MHLHLLFCFHSTSLVIVNQQHFRGSAEVCNGPLWNVLYVFMYLLQDIPRKKKESGLQMF